MIEDDDFQSPQAFRGGFSRGRDGGLSSTHVELHADCSERGSSHVEARLIATRDGHLSALGHQALSNSKSETGRSADQPGATAAQF